jgi:hypothetical protein
MRLVAASLLIIGLGLWLAGLVAEHKNRPLLAAVERWLAPAPASAAPAIDGVPVEAGLLSLAHLKLPAACVPLTHRPLSDQHAAEIALSMMDGSLAKLRCCTECHHARHDDAANERAPVLAVAGGQHCRACHRG